MRFFPKETNFFLLFEDYARVIEASGQLLLQLNKKANRNGELVKKARRLELKADDICHTIYQETNTSFITPIDREDIYLLARTLDNIVDLIENIISNINVYGIKKLEPNFKKFIDLQALTTKHLAQLINLLKDKEKHLPEIKKLIIKINYFENQGDELIRDEFRRLFSNHKNPVEIIKWMDLFENIESVLDECEEVSYLVEDIIIKNF